MPVVESSKARREGWDLICPPSLALAEEEVEEGAVAVGGGEGEGGRGALLPKLPALLLPGPVAGERAVEGVRAAAEEQRDNVRVA